MRMLEIKKASLYRNIAFLNDRAKTAQSLYAYDFYDF